jgi:peptidoglycan/LPS O-acetylase OafA/YrhL
VDNSRHQLLGYRPELDGVRGIAILLVLVNHVHVPGTDNAGSVGVTLFFVLSGFLITSLLIGEHGSTGRVSLRHFYERRARRLLPALFALVAVTGVVMKMNGTGWSTYSEQALPVLLYVGNIWRATGHDLGALLHTWSLSLEEQFYLLWPAIFLLAPRRWLPAAPLAGIAVSVVLQLATFGEPYSWARPDVRADALLWGCLIALVRVRLPGWTMPVGWILLAALCVLPATPVMFAAMSLGAVAVVLRAEPPVLRSRALVRVGELSYGLYLWHFLPASLLVDRTMAGDVTAMAAVIAITFALALASERWIERPFRRRRRSLRTAVPVPVVA